MSPQGAPRLVFTDPGSFHRLIGSLSRVAFTYRTIFAAVAIQIKNHQLSQLGTSFVMDAYIVGTSQA